MTFSVTNTFSNGTVADADKVNTNYTDIENEFNGVTPTAGVLTQIVPIGSIIAWAKHLKLGSTISSGTSTASGIAAHQLIDSGADFVTDAIQAGDLIEETGVNQYAVVLEVVDATHISVTGESGVDNSRAYTIKRPTAPTLPDGWVECAGQTLSDAESTYDGLVIPDMNNNTAGGTHGYVIEGGPFGGVFEGTGITASMSGTGSSFSTVKQVWIMRIK